MMWTQCFLTKVVEERKLEGATDSPEGHAAIQRDLSRLMKFKKCSVLHLHRNNSRHWLMLEATQLEISYKVT